MSRRDLGAAAPSIEPSLDANLVDLDVAIAALIRIRDRAAGGGQSPQPAPIQPVERSLKPGLQPMETYPVSDRLKPGEAAKIAKYSADTIKRWVRNEAIGWISAKGRYTVCRPLLMDLLQSRKSQPTA